MFRFVLSIDGTSHDETKKQFDSAEAAIDAAPKMFPLAMRGTVTVDEVTTKGKNKVTNGHGEYPVYGDAEALDMFPTVQEAAQYASRCFTEGTRADGETFRRLKDGAPAWISDLIRITSGTSFNLDAAYIEAESALDFIADADDAADANTLFDNGDPEADIYTADLMKWAADNIGEVDDAIKETGGESGLISSIQYAQAGERRTYTAKVYEYLAANQVIEIEDADEDEDEDEDEARYIVLSGYQVVDGRNISPAVFFTDTFRDRNRTTHVDGLFDKETTDASELPGLIAECAAAIRDLGHRAGTEIPEPEMIPVINWTENSPALKGLPQSA